MPRPSVQGLGYGTSPTCLAFSKKTDALDCHQHR